MGLLASCTKNREHLGPVMHQHGMLAISLEDTAFLSNVTTEFSSVRDLLIGFYVISDC